MLSYIIKHLIKRMNTTVINFALFKTNDQNFVKKQKNKKIVVHKFILSVLKHPAIKSSDCISGRGFHTNVSKGASWKLKRDLQ